MDIPELIKALDAEIAQQEAELQKLRKKLQLLGEIEALEEMKQLRAKATPIAWYVTGCSTMLDEHDAKAEAKRCGGSAKAVPLYTSPPAQQQPDSNKATRSTKPVEDGWLQDGHMLYRLTDEPKPRNRDEIIVTMVDGSRAEAARTKRASEILYAIRTAEAGKVMK